MILRFIGQSREPQHTFGAALTIATWKLPMCGMFNLVAGAVIEGGAKPLLSGFATGPRHALVAAAAQLCSQLGFTTMLLLTDAATALLLAHLSPLWVGVMCWLALGEALPTRTVVALVGALLSLGVVFVPRLVAPPPEAAEATRPQHALIGNCIALFTGVSVATFITVTRRAAKHCPRASMSAAAGVGAICAGLLSFAAAGITRTSLLDGIEPPFWPLCATSGALIAAGYANKAAALRYLPGTELSLILLLTGVLGPVFVFVGVHEAPPVWTVLGGACLLGVLAAHEIAAMRAASAAAPLSSFDAAASEEGAAGAASDGVKLQESES